jgi:hypothetical protein
MVDTSDVGERIETREDLGKPKSDAAIFAYWMGQEKVAEKEEKKWIKQGREIVKRYRDERPDSAQNAHRFNIFWSNVETLKPAMYARTPKPDVQRTFKDDDPIGLFAAELLQRCLEYSCEAHERQFDEVMKAVVEDRLLPGRATARVLYVPHYGDQITTPDGKDREPSETFHEGEQAGSTVTSEGDEGEDGARTEAESPDADQEEPEREVVYEEVIPKYTFWEDYREGPARQWDEVPWVRFRAYLSRDQLVRQFGKKKGKQVQLDYEPKGMTESVRTDVPPDLYKKAIVHEYWDKDKREVVWIAPSTADVVLDRVDDPLGLPGFFPNGKPLLANKTNDKRIPVADYIQYQDQARELDKITARIDKLTGALKVMGLYPGEHKQELQQLIDEGTENRLVPVHDWQRLIDNGGMKDIIQWMPIQQIAECLIQLYNARDRTKAILYELTGMSDILRGQTSPVETKGAQDLKANFASRRIAPKQKDVAEFACNMIKLMGAIIAEHFSPKTISMITGFPQSQFVPVPQLPPMPPEMIPAPQGQGAPANGVAGLPGQAAVAGAPQAPISGDAGAPAAPGTAMVAMAPNPAYQQWMQARQAVQAAMQKNQAIQKKFDDAVALIKRDGIHGFRIDIEADSTIAPDEQQEKEDRTQFMQQFVPFLQQIVPFCLGNPAAAALGESLTLFAMRPFKVARTLEEAVTKFFDELKQMPPPQPAGGKAGGPDTPEALAQRHADTQSRERIAQQANTVKMAQIASDERIQAAKLVEQASQHHDNLAHQISKEADLRAFRDVKGAAIQANEAKTLQ